MRRMVRIAGTHVELWNLAGAPDWFELEGSRRSSLLRMIPVSAAIVEMTAKVGNRPRTSLLPHRLWEKTNSLQAADSQPVFARQNAHCRSKFSNYPRRTGNFVELERPERDLGITR